MTSTTERSALRLRLGSRRGAVGAARVLPPGPTPPADRLPGVPRERKPALAALAALLILGGALASATLVLRSGDREPAVSLAHRVSPGQQLTLGDLREVQVPRDGLEHIPWSQRGDLTRYYAGPELVPGTLLTAAMITPKALLGVGEVVVGLSLKPGQLPAGLRTGDLVQAYAVEDTTASSAASGPSATGRLLVSGARVYRVGDVVSAGSGTRVPGASTLLSIVVPGATAARLTSAASGGRVAVVQMPQQER